MKLLILILLLDLFTYSYGQNYPALEKLLTKELSKDSQKDGRWVFYADKATIERIIKPRVKSRVPNYEFYQVNLINYLGYHINEGTCLVLFDSLKSKMILIEPLWYNGTSQPLIKLFIGEKFENKDSLLSFLKELNELIEVGSGYRFRNTGFTDSLITYDLGYFKGDSYTTGGNGISSTVTYNKDGVWRKIKIYIKNLEIIRYMSINPKMNGDKEIIE